MPQRAILSGFGGSRFRYLSNQTRKLAFIRLCFSEDKRHMVVWQDSHATIYTVRHGIFLEGLMLFEYIQTEQLE